MLPVDDDSTDTLAESATMLSIVPVVPDRVAKVTVSTRADPTTAMDAVMLPTIALVAKTSVAVWETERRF
jgi:hypothetical protein